MKQLELKDYQRDVLEDLKDFVEMVVQNGNIANTYRDYWHKRGISLHSNNMAIKPYVDTVPGVPRVTAKVPTAGGKTFLACNAISTIFQELPERDAKVVVWFVPSDTILEQTLKNLRDASHPYRQRLDTLFNNRVVVVDKESALMGTNISPAEVREQLTIFVLSAASFIESSRPGMARAFRDNGYLESYAKLFDSNTHRVQNSGETGLIQVISYLNPLVIVDESHNFTADLRVDMFNNVNPCFIYELTATPRDNSNIISFVGADKLKRANMVKLPVIVHNDQSVDAVISNAITLRENLEKQAVLARENEGGEYIRPIVLFQAQPRHDEDSETFEKIKERLTAQYGIPEEQIKIKTADLNELKNIDLMSEQCPVRFIITVNALKEGWDCPFAYILASLANRTSKIDVEQILGRILRQPYAKKHKSTFLNLSYTFTCSIDFQETLANIIKSLNHAGFTASDYRSATPTEQTIPSGPSELAKVDDLFGQGSEDSDADTFVPTQKDISANPTNTDGGDIDTPLTSSQVDSLKRYSEAEVEQILEQAETQSEEYEEQIDITSQNGLSHLSPEAAADANVYALADSFADEARRIRLPHFCVNSTASLLSDTDIPDLLDKDSLLNGFNLLSQNSDISFDITESATRMIDLDADKDFTPVQKGLRTEALNLFRQYYMTLNTEGKVRELTGKILKAINISCISDGQLRSYIQSVLERKSNDELISLAANLGSTIKAFKDKINAHTARYRESRFEEELTVGQIFTANTYSFPETVVLPKTCLPLSKSLYREEDSMNNFEYRVIQKVADLDNVLFWHRNLEMKGFCINGYINHYPDFIVVTKKGIIIMLETKGDDRQNPDSAAKLKLGKTWASTAGPKYRYFMVFDNKPLPGAHSLNDFIALLSQL